MKKLFLMLSVFYTSSCANESLNMAEARRIAESAIQLIGEENFDALQNIYTNDFKNSETKQVRDKKFSDLVKVTGKTIEHNLTDSIRENNAGEESRIILKYKVKHANTTTTETYTIVHEDGRYLLSNIYISNN